MIRMGWDDNMRGNYEIAKLYCFRAENTNFKNTGILVYGGKNTGILK